MSISGFYYRLDSILDGIASKPCTAVLKLVKKLRKLNLCSIRSFAQLIGSLGACCPPLPYACVYTKQFEREKVLALEYSEGNYDAQITLPAFREDFAWWETNLPVG